MPTITDFLPKDLFADKVVFVTGGGSGINLGVARNFAALGAKIGICGRTLEKLEAARAELQELGATVSISVADVRDFDALAVAFTRSQEELGLMDVLVCGAAGNFISPAEALSPNGFKAVIDIDLIGSFNAARGAFAQLQETKGSILFISAGQAYIPYFAQSHVGAAKAGVDNLMQNLALEWGRYGIRSNSIVPGPIDGTEGMNRLAPGKLKEKLPDLVPLKRLGSVDDIGMAAVFLSSPMASYITGSRLIVDGGQNLPGSGLFGQLVQSTMGAQPKKSS